MKKTTKTLLWLALAFFLSGAALGIASLCAGFNYNEFVQNVEAGRFNLGGPARKLADGLGVLSADEKGKTFEQSYTGVKALNLKVGLADCEIIPCDGEEWKVEGERLNSRFSCKLDDGELSVNCKRPRLSFLRTKNNTSKLRLYAPRDQILKKIDIDAEAGTIAMTGDSDFLKCEELKLECGVGKTSLRVDIREEGKLEGGVGEVSLTLAGKEDNFNYKVEYGVGNVSIDGEKHSGLGGDYEVDNDAAKDLKVECGVGSVNLLFEETGARTLTTHHEEEEHSHYD